MRDLQMLFKRCCEELDAIGVPYSHNIKSIKANNRYVSTYGMTSHYTTDDSYEIQIASFLLSDKLTDDRIVRSTIFHELVHTCDGCMNHGKLFHKYGNLISDCYDVEITTYVSKARLDAVKQAGIKPERKRIASDNWIFECIDCCERWQYKKKPSFCRQYEPVSRTVLNCNCPYCKGKIRLVKGIESTINKLQRVYTF